MKCLNANRAITAIAGYMMACEGMLFLIDAEESGQGGDWWAMEG